MKKVFLALALVALVVVSCKQSEVTTPLTTDNSTRLQVDSVTVDSTSLDTTAVK